TDVWSRVLRVWRVGEDGGSAPAILGLKRSAWFRGSHKHHAGRQVRPTMFDPSIKVFPIHFRHVQVAQDRVVAVLSEQVEGFTPIRCGVHMMTVPPQREVKQFPGVWFIFNDQDVVGHCHHLIHRTPKSAAGSRTMTPSYPIAPPFPVNGASTTTVTESGKTNPVIFGRLCRPAPRKLRHGDGEQLA